MLLRFLTGISSFIMIKERRRDIKMSHTLKSGALYTIREATREDASEMLQYISQIAGESNNLTFGPGDFEITLEDEARFIDQSLHTNNQLFLVATLNDKIIGNLNFNGGHRPRIAHDGEFGVSVLKSYWSNGIANALIKYLLEWARNGNIITKINLKVRDDNENAIHLYKQLGFSIEGHISRQFLIEGQYYSVYHMGIEL